LKGIILKGIGGFYYVKTEDEIFECKAKGVFRKEKLTPVAGDRVEITALDNGKGVIDEILLRKNEWLRPPLANLDQIVMVVSACEPVPNLLNLDKLLTIAEYKEIEPIIAITKIDLDPSETEKLQAIYDQAGFTTLLLDNTKPNAGEVLLPYLEGKVTALAGNSGVGKSSLLNRVFGDEFFLETSQISQKLGRGRHTTRHVELYPIGSGYVADTPGFSTIEMNKYALIRKEEMQYCFREFRPFLDGDCRFQDCSHTAEYGCAVKEALEAGKIPPTRYQNYCQLYEEAKLIKEWENK